MGGEIHCLLSTHAPAPYCMTVVVAPASFKIYVSNAKYITHNIVHEAFARCHFWAERR